MGLIRKLMIETRNRLDRKEERSAEIAKLFFSHLPEDVKKVFIFAGVDSEVQTLGIIEELIKKGIRVYCPKVCVRDIHFFEVSSLSDLQPGYHRIPEPAVEEEDRDLEKIAAEKAVDPTDTPDCLMVMPGVVFDETGGRMGYGAGMYDRYLAKHPCRKIGLAYEIQVRESPLYLKPTDIRVDALITEKCYRSWDHQS